MMTSRSLDLVYVFKSRIETISLSIQLKTLIHNEVQKAIKTRLI